MSNGINTTTDFTAKPDAFEGQAAISADYDGAIKLPGGYGAAISIHGEASATADIARSDGMVTYSASVTASVSVTGTLSGRQDGLEVTRSGSFEMNYTVAIPEGEFSPTSIATVIPADPNSIPVGSSITMDQSQQHGRGMELSFRGVSIGNNLTESESASMRIERVSETTVRVTSGSSEGVAATNTLGVSAGPVSATLSNDASLEGSTVTVIEFDISTPEGRAQYEYYIANGTLPPAENQAAPGLYQPSPDQPAVDPNAEGIVSMQVVETVDYNSESSIGLAIFNAKTEIAGPDAAYSNVTVTDLQTGTSHVTTTVSRNDNVPLRIEFSFDSNGNEIGRTYILTFTLENEGQVQQMNVLETGQPEGRLKVGDTVEVSMTAEQMDDYRANQLAPAAAAATNDEGHLENPMFAELRQDPYKDGFELPTTTRLVQALTQNHGNDETAVLNILIGISEGADGEVGNGVYTPLPATFEVVEPAQP